MAFDSQTASFPDFIVIGAMRAGTTTLYHHLYQHPELGLSRMKETDYFVRKMNYSLGYDWYKSQFDPGFRLYGEVSPNYAKQSLWKGVPQRIADVAPKARLIYLVRDPVDRFVSHYMHARHFGFTEEPPETVLDSENGIHMLDCSRYALQVETYLTAFPRDQILILDFARLRTDTQALIDEITDFLGVARMTVDAGAVHNDGASVSAVPPWVEKIWRSRAMRRLDPLISRGMRDRARSLVSGKSAKPKPIEMPEAVKDAARAALREDAERFRPIAGQDFPHWSV